MRSVVDIENSKITDARMISLTVSVVGSLTEIENVFDFLRIAVRERFLKPKTCLLFDSQRVEQAECSLQLLRTSSFQFRIPEKIRSYLHRSWEKTYWGYFCSEDQKDKIHQHLFSSRRCCWDDEKTDVTPTPYFSKSLMEELLKDIYQAEMVINHFIPTADLIIRVDCEGIEPNLAKGTFCCQIAGYSVEYENTEILQWYDDIVKKLDEKYGFCFHSAYVSYATEGIPVSHAGFFNNHVFDQGVFLLGCEWSAYLCDKLLQKIPEEDFAEISKIATVERLEHGVRYVAETAIDMFSKSERGSLQQVLKSVLRSGYAVIDWNGLCNQKIPLFSESFDKVALYRERHFGSKSLIIPFQIPLATIEAAEERYRNQCSGVFLLT